MNTRDNSDGNTKQVGSAMTTELHNDLDRQNDQADNRANNPLGLWDSGQAPEKLLAMLTVLGAAWQSWSHFN